MNKITKNEIAIGDLVETFAHKIGVITEISKKDICLSTIDDDIKIYLCQIKAIRYFPPKCLKHHKRNCEICYKKVPKCDRCCNPGTYCIDPYDLEVNEKEVYCCLCDECYQERIDSI